jgi:ubiquinone/menaquinone biosynthesis C-methylase UbiE
MEERLQRWVQRHGWDRAAPFYPSLWEPQLAPAHDAVLAGAALSRGEAVLDAACGTGVLALRAAQQVAPGGRVVGVDTSARMVEIARQRAREGRAESTSFIRNEFENLLLPGGSFDAVLCALGLMYMPDPRQALQVMRRLLRPGGRVGIAVWGRRSHCGWSAVFSIVESEVRSDVCPLFFQLGEGGVLAAICAEAGLGVTAQRRIETLLEYADADQACAAVFLGGPAALAWARFDEPTRRRARGQYLETIEAWRHGQGYAVPGEFVVVTAATPSDPRFESRSDLCPPS